MSAEGNHSDPGPEVIELKRRVLSLEIRYRDTSLDVAEIKGLVARTHSLAETIAKRVANIDKDRDILRGAMQQIRVDIAELRGRVQSSEDTGQHAALVAEAAVEAAVRASRSDLSHEKKSDPPSGPESLRARMSSWRPKTRRDWAKLAVITAASLAAIAGAAQQVVSLLLGH